MRRIDASSLFTGEVLGQRPMSKHGRAMDIIDRECGITMEIYDGSVHLDESAKHACYGPGEKEDVESAAAICERLKIPFQAIDLRQEYKYLVIDYFRNEYLEGKTPNPCVVCNQKLKFGFLLEKAKQAGLDFDYFATGHYARIVKSDNRFLLKRAADRSKDQTYFLYALTPQQLARTLFPVGDYIKQQVREMARSLGLQTVDREESQDFIDGRDYSTFPLSADTSFATKNTD